LLAKDRLAYKSPYFGGVKSIQVLANGRIVFNQKIDQVNLSETRKINTVLNFKAYRSNGSKFYKLYLDDGNDLPIADRTLHGKLRIESELTKIEVRLTDASGNSSSLFFSLKKTEPAVQTSLLEPLRENLAMDISENVLKISAKGCGDKKALVFHKNQSLEKAADYYNANQSIYLIDLRELLPDSVVTCNGTFTTHLKAIVPSGINYTYYGDWADITFDKEAIYDTLYLALQKRSTNDSLIAYRIGDALTPLHKPVSVSLKSENITWGRQSAVYRLAGKGYTYVGGELNNDRINFSTRELGEFVILKDTVPPTVRSIYLNAQNIRLKIRDDLSGISRFQATINGQWLLLHYDAKTGILMSEKKNKNEPLKGEVIVEVTDLAGNKVIFTSKIL
jgi:hypothetical protein